MKFEVEILSPVHIGDGTKKRANEIYLKDGYVYSVNLAEFRNILDNKQKEKMDKEWEKAISQNRCPDLTKFINNNAISFSPTGIRVKTDISINDKSEIIPFIKTSNKPIIPGSEIKGSIRTAILYKRLKDDPSLVRSLSNNLKTIEKKHNLKTLLQNYKDAQKEVRDTGKNLGEIKENCMKSPCTDLISLMNIECVGCSHYLLSASAKTPLDLIKTKPRSGKKDSVYCKFVKENEPRGCKKNLISRSIRGEFDSTYSFTCSRCKYFSSKDIRSIYAPKHSNYFSLKTKRDNAHKAWEDEKKSVSEEISKLISDIEKELFQFTNDVKTSFFKNLIVSDTKPFNKEDILIAIEKIIKPDKQMPHDFIKEFLVINRKSSLQLQTYDLRNRLLFQDSNKDGLTIEYIRNACNEFALAKIDSELAYFRRKDFQNRNEYNAVKIFYTTFKNTIAKDDEKIYLRLGAGQGILSITIDLLLKGTDVYKDLIASLKENRANINDDYPASRRIVNIDGGLPPGWIALKEIKS